MFPKYFSNIFMLALSANWYHLFWGFPLSHVCHKIWLRENIFWGINCRNGCSIVEYKYGMKLMTLRMYPRSLMSQGLNYTFHVTLAMTHICIRHCYSSLCFYMSLFYTKPKLQTIQPSVSIHKMQKGKTNKGWTGISLSILLWSLDYLLRIYFVSVFIYELTNKHQNTGTKG